MGLHPKPDFIFCLDTKNEAKKVTAAPASLKKATVHWLKGFKLISKSTFAKFKQKTFLNVYLTSFFAAPAEAGPNKHFP